MSDSPTSRPNLPVVRIHDMAHGGEGVGRAEGEPTVVFVRDTVVGDQVRVEVEKDAKRFRRGRVAELLEPSEDRVEHPCSIADRCGGCGWQHIAVDAQLRHKQGIVAGQMRRLPLKLELATPSPQSTGYRRRARMHYSQNDGGGLVLGFRRAQSHELVDVDTCLVLGPELDRAFQKIRRIAEHLPPKGEVTGLSDGAQVVLGLPGATPGPELIAACESVLDETLVGFSLRGARKRHVVGRAELHIDGGSWPAVVAGPFAFAQAQAAQNEVLVGHVASEAKAAGRTVLELYCGSGNFTRALAPGARQVRAIDEDREAIQGLRRLAERHQWSVDARRQSVEAALDKLEAKRERFDVAVLDPPRAGLGEKHCRRLARLVDERIVYISCDPATLARDLRALLDGGFAVRDARVFDLMPMTSEVETVVTLVRAKPS